MHTKLCQLRSQSSLKKVIISDGRIFVKFRIWDFYYNFSIHSEFGENQAEKTDNLDEKLRRFKTSCHGWFSLMSQP
jgi:hypothetical protein